MKVFKLPQKDDFEQNYILKSFGSRVIVRKKMPIIAYLHRYNKKKQIVDGWLLSLLASFSPEYVSLLSFFFYGSETASIFSKAMGDINNDNDNNTPGLQLFKKKLAHASVQVSNQEEFKSKLLAAVESSYQADNINVRHPVIALLSETNKKLNRSGWLFNLNVSGKKAADRSKNDLFLATALYNIIGIGYSGCNTTYCEVLYQSLGSGSATSLMKKKEWICNITRNFMKEVIDDNNNNNIKNNNNKRATEGMGCTISTAPTAAITEPSTTSDRMASSTLIQRKPPSIVTNMNNDNRMAVSPLTDRTSNTASFGFSSRNNTGRFLSPF